MKLTPAVIIICRLEDENCNSENSLADIFHSKMHTRSLFLDGSFFVLFGGDDGNNICFAVNESEAVSIDDTVGSL